MIISASACLGHTTLAKRAHCSSVGVPSSFPPCSGMLCPPHSPQAPTLCQALPAAAWQRQVLWGCLVPATGRGIPWHGAEPASQPLLLQSLWIAVGSLEAAAPCQGPGHSSFTRTLLSAHIMPQLSIWRSKYAIFSFPVIFPAVAVAVGAAGKCE